MKKDKTGDLTLWNKGLIAEITLDESDVEKHTLSDL